LAPVEFFFIKLQRLNGSDPGLCTDRQTNRLTGTILWLQVLGASEAYRNSGGFHNPKLQFHEDFSRLKYAVFHPLLSAGFTYLPHVRRSVSFPHGFGAVCGSAKEPSVVSPPPPQRVIRSDLKSPG